MKKIIASLTLGIALACLVACAPQSDIEKTYIENDYNITYNPDIEIDIDSSKIAFAFVATKDTFEGKQDVTVVSFNESKFATEFYNFMYQNSGNRFRIIKKRNAVIFGSEEAVGLVSE